MKRLYLHKLKYRLNCAALLLAMLLLSSLPAGAAVAGNGGETPPERVQMIDLEQALEMAREAGPTLEQVEIELGLAQSRLDEVKRSYNIGTYYDSRAMKQDMEELEQHIDKKLETILELREQIEAWQEEKEELEDREEMDEAARLGSKINEAQQEKAVQEQELLDIRRGYANMVPRYYEMKAREDAARSQLDPLELQRDAAKDELSKQPGLLDYRVESFYLTLLLLDDQLDYQRLLLENQQRMLAREEVMVELGMSTSLRLVQVETALEQITAAIEKVQAERDSLKRDFAILLGLPVESRYDLVSIPDGRLDVSRQVQQLTDKPVPDLMQSLDYQRAVDVRRRRELDLDDTSKRDTHKYREAELNLKKAELDLEMTLDSLRAGYRDAREELEVAEKGLHNAKLQLQNGETNLERAELRYSLGTIARVELEQQELELQDERNKKREALNQYYLAFRAYVLARQGIMV